MYVMFVNRLHELVYTCTSKLWEKESINNRMRQEWMHLNQLFCVSAWFQAVEGMVTFSLILQACIVVINIIYFIHCFQIQTELYCIFGAAVANFICGEDASHLLFIWFSIMALPLLKFCWNQAPLLSVSSYWLKHTRNT